MKDALKVAGLTAAAGAAIGAAAYGINNYMSNKTSDDDHYEYEDEKDKEKEDEFEEIETLDDSLNNYNDKE